jgi:CRP/FNR family transcriptional regulator, anaerobic regulatory protein
MSSDVKEAPGHRIRGVAAGEQALPALDPALARLAAHASKIRTRKGQSIGLTLDGHEATYIVRAGALMLQVAAAATPRQVAAFLLPGDVLRGSAVPPHAEASLISANAAELWRFRWSAMEDFAAADRGLARFLQDAAAARLARYALHTAVLGQFSSEQRVATVLTELAMLTGTPLPAGGIVIDMPFRRNDLADYLGLNPDTLSRIVARLRRDGILGHSARSRALVRDFRALARLTPAARSLAEIHQHRRGDGLALFA